MIRRWSQQRNFYWWGDLYDLLHRRPSVIPSYLGCALTASASSAGEAVLFTAPSNSIVTRKQYSPLFRT